MSDISIQPIFNQSAPGVWNDFLRIRIDTMMYSCDMPMSPVEIASAYEGYANDWKRYSRNFAFGAYDDKHMIGCVNGFVCKNIGTLSHLHVRPEYQGQHIGCRLLNAAQNAASIMGARHMKLVALSHARNFYDVMGYTGLSWAEYHKNLSQPKCNCVPVFYCSASLARACGFRPDTAKQINDLHCPMFISYDHNSNINGYIVNDKNGSTLIEVRDNNPRQIIRRSLERAVQSYLSHASYLKSR